MPGTVINAKHGGPIRAIIARLTAHEIGITADNMLRHPMNECTREHGVQHRGGWHDRLLDMRCIIKAGDQVLVLFLKLGLCPVSNLFLLFKLRCQRFSKVCLKPQL